MSKTPNANLRPRARLAELTDVEGALRPDRIVYHDQSQWLSDYHLRKWIENYRGNIFVLEDNGQIIGRAECLPVSQNTLKELLAMKADSLSLTDIDNLLIGSDKAHEYARVGGPGNVLYVDTVAFELRTNQERYDHAVPLFLAHLGVFRTLRMRAVFGLSRTELGAAVWRNAGARTIRTSISPAGTRIKLWAFEGEQAEKNIASGLSVVYFTNWAVSSSCGVLRLTPKERETMRILMDSNNYAAANKEIAEILGVAAQTIKDRFNDMFDKGARAGIFAGKRPNRLLLLKYCIDHPEEVLPTLDDIHG